jgi:O-antigen ligase
MDVWRTHIESLERYPIAGAPAGATVDGGYFGDLTAGTKEWDLLCAHNVFLDFGTNAGLPGLLFFVVMFLRAPIAIVRRRGLGYAGPFIAVLVAIFFAFFDYSAGTWKLYWAFLALVVYEAGYSERRFSMSLPVARSHFGKPLARRSEGFADRAVKTS